MVENQTPWSFPLPHPLSMVEKPVFFFLDEHIVAFGALHDAKSYIFQPKTGFLVYSLNVRLWRQPAVKNRHLSGRLEKVIAAQHIIVVRRGRYDFLRAWLRSQLTIDNVLMV